MTIQLSGPPYKGIGNQWLTEALFWDKVQARTLAERKYEPIFCLYEDRKGMVNCRTTFVALRDPTGRKWAMTYLGDWEHWKRLIRCTWFKEAYEAWCHELDQVLKSEAMEVLNVLLKGENPAQAIQAAKIILAQDYKEAKVRRGRPSSEEVAGELKRAAQARSEEDDDMARLGLSTKPQETPLTH